MTERFQKTFLLLICIFGATRQIFLNAEKLYALHTDELISGQLVIPQRIDRNGEFLTHKLTHHHKQHYRHHRRRRSLTDDDDDDSSRQVEESDSKSKSDKSLNLHDDYLHYRLNLENETLHLELEPHTYFLAPNLIVERHRRDLRTRYRPTRNTNCHYHGKVRDESESRVAISTCDGLVGHIKTRNNEYFIEPSKNHDAHPINGHPHVVFHRSSVKQKEQQSNKANKPKRKKHRRKQNNKQQQQSQSHLQSHQLEPHQQQRVPVSNCGTREPRRRMETRLEWQPLGKVKIQGGRKIRRHRNHYHQRQQQLFKRRPHHRRHHRHHQNHNKNNDDHQTPAKYEYQTAADASLLPQNELNSAGRAISTSTTTIKTTTMARGNDINNINDVDKITSISTSTSKSKARQRTKRSISSPRHVEAMIVADETMVSFHGDVERYLLSIMNMVSSLYKDPSIGNSIEIVVVKIALLNETDATHPHLNLTLNAQQNLDTFCSWQHNLNSDNETDPHHHDVAILVTRKNICGDNCMTLGLANVGGMCKPRQSCSVNEDNGIMLSHTIAHELGHNFGMFHDTAKIGCHPRIGPIVHIMTPTFGADTLQVMWSNCSRKFITNFLDQGFGDCLDDAPEPPDQYLYPENPPGVLFNAELQCRLQFNVTDGKVGVCSSMNEICTQLWCRVNDECVTNMRPTAPGTSCGQNMWCQNGKCVHKTEVTPINGGWGKWSKWSKCSRKCGGGVSIQQRECNNPLPQNGGLFCIGERKRYKVCEQQPCPSTEPSFRAQQCSNFDHVLYQGGKYQWLPFFDKNNPCKLFCTDVDDTVIANWGDVVLDGTPCTLGTNNMCIDGICKKIGCDWVVDSDLQEDRCGICGGKGDQCQPVKEVFNEPFNATEGYIEIVTIPARARHIIVRELGNSPNFLAISKEKENLFYLNGDSLISMPGEFIIAGAESLYDRIDEQETINIPQPIEHSIAVYVIIRSDEPNDGIYYEFTLPALNLSKPHAEYSWELSDWTHCSTTCGGGLQYREALCHENGKLIPTQELCWSFAKNRRPLRLTRSCNKNQCPSHWWVGPWQFCPVTCSSPNSQNPVKRRSVMCLDQNEVVVEDDKCSGITRPPEIEPCESLPLCEVTKSTAEFVSSRNENLILRVKNV